MTKNQFTWLLLGLIIGLIFVVNFSASNAREINSKYRYIKTQLDSISSRIDSNMRLNGILLKRDTSYKSQTNTIINNYNKKYEQINNANDSELNYIINDLLSKSRTTKFERSY